jgi:hypothetical protein
MAPKALDDSQIQSLLRHEKRASYRVSEWPNSADRKLLHDAASHHRKTVVFSDGNKYALRYDMRDSIAWGKYEIVFVSRSSDMLDGPCGWFRIKSLLAERS